MTALSRSDTALREALPGGAPSGTDVGAAGRVLRLEAEGILALAQALDERLSRALDILAQVAGRVVVTGMGKSGHVARKIASTMASTGTPALFVHPGEASHGDLGMIAKQDAVIALSNSGNTAELANIIGYTRRFQIPLIAVTGRADSALADAADVALMLPHAAEACPMGLAPTTSTTMMLALGDALAIALLERKGFSQADFQVLHPGGQLGQRLLRVAAVMHGGEATPLVARNVLMSEAILEMTAKGFGCAGITDESGRLVGIITDGDLRRHMSSDLLARPASAVMTANPRTIHPNAFAAEALGLMNGLRGERPITSLFVVDGDRPIGIIRMHDCLRAGIA